MIDCTMKGYMVLDVSSGVSKKGNTFYSMTVFRDGRIAEVSCTKPELFAQVAQLREMDTVNLDVRAVSGKERSYLSLLDAPVMVEPSPLAGE